MKNGIFITGTGTGVGKTIFSSLLLKLLRLEGIDAWPLKPVQTGVPDLDFSIETANLKISAAEYLQMAPYSYKTPCSPHLAVELEGGEIELSRIKGCVEKLKDEHQFLIVEGAGGIFAPITADQSMIDVMLELEFEVIVVASSQLGTLNHTLLTLEALEARGISVVGLVLSDQSEDAGDSVIATSNVEYLSKKCGVPILLRVPFLQDATPTSVSQLADSLFKQGTGKKFLESLDVEQESIESMREIDHKHLWHPFTDITRFENAKEYRVIERGSGTYLIDSTGKRLLDGISSWWSVNLGHSNKTLLSAMQKSSRKLQQAILADMAHPDAVYLSEELSAILPKGLNHLFYASDGSSAVEAALKIGLQYWWNKGVEGKNKFVYLENSYHGDTLAAVSVGYVDTFHQPFKHVMWPNLAAPSPLTTNTRPENKTIETWNEESFQPMEKLLRESCKEVAAVIVEPICQAVGGMRIYSPDYLKRLSKLCKELGVLLIADEIAVGFGRTGVMFACEYADISPDMVIIGKGMTSGFIPMSALAATTEVYDSFRNESANPEKNRTFFHGHTYSGHPLAAACARATLKVFKEEGIIESLSPKSKIIEDGFKELPS
jgi:adenosylmethionine-8-amino-7-oxononanoate aminotransferase